MSQASESGGLGQSDGTIRGLTSQFKEVFTLQFCELAFGEPLAHLALHFLYFRLPKGRRRAACSHFE